MPLSLHLFIHFSLALLTGFLAGYYFKKLSIGLIAGFLGGFLIDLDHVLEYFLVFDWSFNIQHFLQGRQFLISDHIYLWFHAWEYVVILIIMAKLFYQRRSFAIFLFVLALAASVHLLSDSLINNYPLKYYSLVYRQEMDFSAEKLLNPLEYQKNQVFKRELGL